MTDNPYFAAYPYLANLLGGWFHQDYDIDGDVPEIIPKYAASVSRAELWATIADIQRFLALNAGDPTAAFDRILRPDIDPAGWNMTASAWLTWVETLLIAAADTPAAA